MSVVSMKLNQKQECPDKERKAVEYRVHRYLSICYRKLGFFIAKHPFIFVLVPIIVSAILSTGLIYLDINEDTEYLFVPENAVSLQDKLFIQRWFPTNTSESFDPSRLSSHGQFVAIIATARDGNCMLRETIFNDLNELNKFIQNITVEHEGKTYWYEELCAKNNGHCVENEILKRSWKIKAIESRRDRIKFPVDYSNKTYNYTFYVMNLGGVSCDDNGFVEEVKAIRLLYYLRADNKEQMEIARKWGRKFNDAIGIFHRQNISVFHFSKLSLEGVLNENFQPLKSMSIITALVMLVYSVVCCMKLDLVTSKPWLGLAGLCSVLLSLASTFGLMSYCSVEMNAVAGMVAFLIFGIGMDDAFILIAAWRQTNPSKDVSKRMSSAYSEATTSITITSMTNMLCFCVGITIPFPAIRAFCLYATTAVIFVFIYQITFFGGCMTFSGYREARNLNPFTFRPVSANTSEKRKRKAIFFYTRKHLQFTTSEDKGQEAHETDWILNGFMQFFSHFWTKISILFIIVAFLSVCVWSCFHLKEGQDFASTFPYKSSSSLFLKMVNTHFSQFPYRLHVVVKEKLDYSNPYVQKQIESLLQKLEQNPYIGGSSLTESWLRFYLIFLKMKETQWSIRVYNVSSKEDFVDALWNVFLKYPQTKHLTKDLVFNDDHSEILYSRFMIQTINLFDSDEEKAMLAGVRKIVEESTIPISIYNTWFPFREQLLVIKDIAIRSLIIASVMTMISFFAFVPNILYSICAALSVVSIEIGAIGLMSFWHVTLDMTSTTALVMCVGFSIDYTAHICFAYANSREKCWQGRYGESIRKLGIPILQSSTTTILGVLSLAFIDSYCYIVLFKIVFLVVTISAVQALFGLPLLVNGCDILSRKCRRGGTIRSESLALNKDRATESLNSI